MPAVADARVAGKVVSGICDFVCLCVSVLTQNKNGLSYEHQTWYTWTLACIDSEVKRSRLQDYDVCVGMGMHVDMTA